MRSIVQTMTPSNVRVEVLVEPPDYGNGTIQLSR
jgi:hypothetical protein